MAEQAPDYSQPVATWMSIKTVAACRCVSKQRPVAPVSISQPTLDASYAVVGVTRGNACQVNKRVERRSRETGSGTEAKVKRG